VKYGLQILDPKIHFGDREKMHEILTESVIVFLTEEKQ
jgi:hypothetical protein